MPTSRLSPLQQAIIVSLYRFRFLSSRQLSLLLNRPLRLTNYHLHVLVSHNYLSRHYHRAIGRSHHPAVYYLSTGSLAHVKRLPRTDPRALRRIYREPKRTPAFIARCLWLADWHLSLSVASQKTNHTLHFFTQTDLMSYPYVIKPLPDAYIARRAPHGHTKRYFVEVIAEHLPRFALRKRIEQYNEYLESGHFEAATGHPFPTILFVCPGRSGLIYLKKHVMYHSEALSLDQTRLFVTTRADALLPKWERLDPDLEL